MTTLPPGLLPAFLLAASCRLAMYTPRSASLDGSPGTSILCNGADGVCVEPCRDGFKRTASGACRQVCPAGYGLDHECTPTATCVRPGTSCPNLISEVDHDCPSPSTLIGAPAWWMLHVRVMTRGIPAHRFGAAGAWMMVQTVHSTPARVDPSAHPHPGECRCMC